MTELNIFVAASADDAYCETGANWDSTHIYGPFGHLGATFYADVYLRFLNVTIPKGATINSALVRFVCGVVVGTTVVRTNITGEDVDSASQCTSCADVAGRARTTALEAWDNVPIWTLGAEYDTVDIADIIQEIVDRAGWVSGNDVNIFVDNDGSGSGAYRHPSHWDNVTYNPPQLRVTYTPHVVGGYAAIF